MAMPTIGVFIPDSISSKYIRKGFTGLLGFLKRDNGLATRFGVEVRNRRIE